MAGGHAADGIGKVAGPARRRTGRVLCSLVAAAALTANLRRERTPVQTTFIKAGFQQRPPLRGAASRQVASSGVMDKLDASYNPDWSSGDGNSVDSMAWEHQQTFWAAAATAFYAFDMVRFFALVPPVALEVVFITLIYMGLYGSRLQEVQKLEKHYQVSFYASVGWTFYAITSLVHAMAYSPDPMLSKGAAEGLHSVGAMVYLASCGYFYSYHWGRQLRHVQEGRFRPLFAGGLASLTFVHGLTVAHIFKMFDDSKWYETVNFLYPDQWHWVADTRLAELYLTALALFLVILHLRGVLTGTRNAVWVFLGTVIAPTAALFYETMSLNAVAWNHYWMVGPKYW
eukprot:TRINITY_DN9533_c0_g1_i1.p1 TRINITY_DN9533_c0_g1~~TRINITY_DN9533_c0_g1_i1.p1  ORF type:complete len:343 (+),score=66.68 TRINITY_DN9533_c0_g1_i1:93-1121(+)